MSFNHPERVRSVVVKEKNREILKALNRTKVEKSPDLEGALCRLTVHESVCATTKLRELDAACLGRQRRDGSASCSTRPSARSSGCRSKPRSGKRARSSSSRRSSGATRTSCLRVVGQSMWRCGWRRATDNAMAWTRHRSLMTRDKIQSGPKIEAAADLSSVNAYEEDFM